MSITINLATAPIVEVIARCKIQPGDSLVVSRDADGDFELRINDQGVDAAITISSLDARQLGSALERWSHQEINA